MELNPYVTCVTSPDAPGLILMAGDTIPPPVSRLRLEVVQYQLGIVLCHRPSILSQRDTRCLPKR